MKIGDLIIFTLPGSRKEWRRRIRGFDGKRRRILIRFCAKDFSLSRSLISGFYDSSGNLHLFK
jgi:hypothetical protein